MMIKSTIFVWPYAIDEIDKQWSQLKMFISVSNDIKKTTFVSPHLGHKNANVVWNVYKFPV